MNTIFLLISPIQIVLFLIVLLSIAIYSLVLASRNEKNMNFLIWALLIIFLPFIGGISYIIKYHTANKKSIA